MLDNGTKNRINNARDILVGKVPDPKAQVEQITTALIYKFMHDMDQEAVELGGVPSFFVEEYAQFDWAKLMDKALGGHKRLDLYVQAIDRMSRNPHLPQLFRDIFKDAFLPYRDPETLNLFLKEINGFTYDHSERLGDAFEYLLSVLGSQGEAGQFRTPRHIIDFIVEVVAPTKTDTILDPACGTAGFLISAYKHILAKNEDTPLTPDERERLTENFVGYDIAPEMVRLSLVNMYLHHFPQPTIYEYDTLTSEDRWDEHFDVILANPPFMSPKGGIRPHSRFAIQSKRSEVLFVDYIAEHLNPSGRAGVIVPEGIIFQSSNAYKDLRRMLIEENYLWAVVSLPSGVFNPYSGVKTSILLMDTNLAKRAERILFVEVENDGFGLGAQRRDIDQDDLPAALEVVRSFRADPGVEVDSPLAHAVPKEKIAKDGDYSLSRGRYREIVDYSKVKWPMVSLGDKQIFRIESGGTPSTKKPEYWEGDIYWATFVDLPQENFITRIIDTQRKITSLGLEKSSAKLLPPNTVLISSRATIGRIAIAEVPLATNQGFKNIVIEDHSRVNSSYLAYVLTRSTDQMTLLASGGTFKEISKKNIATLQIPLPPLAVQRTIVAELDSYQAIINGARQVVENYKPHLPHNSEWEMANIGNLCETSSGGTPLRSKKEYYENGTIPWLRSGEVSQGFITGTENFITPAGLENSSAKIFPVDTVLVAMYGATAGQVGLLKIKSTTNQAVCGIFPCDELLPEFLYYFLLSKTDYIIKQSTGGAQPNISQKIIRKLKVPVPPLEDQRKLVAQIGREQALVEANRELIKIFQEKIDRVLAEIWGEEKKT